MRKSRAKLRAVVRVEQEEARLRRHAQRFSPEHRRALRQEASRKKFIRDAVAKARHEGKRFTAAGLKQLQEAAKDFAGKQLAKELERIS